MDNLESILKRIDFPVLISTVIGGVILWLVSERSKLGNIEWFFGEPMLRGYVPDGSGGLQETKNLADERISRMSFCIKCNMYNTSDHIKIARNVKAKTLVKGLMEYYSVYLNNSLTTSMNFEPKKLQSQTIEIQINKKN